MTTPAERVALEAVLRWREDTADHAAKVALLAAADALAVERAAGHTEQELTFAELVAGDLIQSVNGRWYEVARTATDLDQTGIKVWLVGAAKPLEKFRGQTVLTRRSEMGAAVDVFAAVLWSGPDATAARREKESVA